MARWITFSLSAQKMGTNTFIAGPEMTLLRTMPTAVKKQSCEQSDGTNGDFVVYNTVTGEIYSCHATEADAKASQRIRESSKES